MAKLSTLTEKTTVEQDDILYAIQSPYGTGDDRKITVANLGNASGRYQGRGDPSSADWTQATLTFDSAWHDLDCSSIVPDGAKWIEFYATVTTLSSALFMLRKKGNSNAFAVDEKRASNSLSNAGRMRTECNAGRVVQYYGQSSISTLSLTVVAWAF